MVTSGYSSVHSSCVSATFTSADPHVALVLRISGQIKADSSKTAKGDPMGNQGYRSNYLEAFDAANHQLEHIYSEYHDLQHRKEQLEGVLVALEAFLQSGGTSTAEFHSAEIAHHEPQPVHTEIYATLQPLAEPAMRAERVIETPAPPAFAPAEEGLDPLQLRINRALGLAVA
jgi:hypothetical protein